MSKPVKLLHFDKQISTNGFRLTRSQGMAQANGNSPFWSLPVELRLEIYRMIMVFDKPVRITKPKGHYLLVPSVTSNGTITQPQEAENSKQRDRCTALAFAMTCRQAYLDSIQLYYTANTFSLTVHRCLTDFFTAVEQTHLDMITKVQIGNPGDKDFAAFCKLNNIETLEIIGLTIHEWWLPDGGSRAKKHFWDFCAHSRKLKRFSIDPDSVIFGVRSDRHFEYQEYIEIMEREVNTYIRRRSWGEGLPFEGLGFRTLDQEAFLGCNVLANSQPIASPKLENKVGQEASILHLF